jgi:hypothetical protein
LPRSFSLLELPLQITHRYLDTTITANVHKKAADAENSPVLICPLRGAQACSGGKITLAL